jgi:taurine dioxygenase
METRPAYRATPLKSDFGVEIVGFDVTRASNSELGEVADAIFRHGAAVLRDQRLDPSQQIAFTRFFGEPAENARLQFTVPDFPEVFVISNKLEGDRVIGDPEAGLGWHTDYTYGKRPALCTILHALEVPPEGCDTLLADLLAAWDALPEERRRQVSGRVIRHSYERLMQKQGRQITPEQKAALPDVFHPMVRLLPELGRKTLWVAKGTAHEIVGMPNPAGLDLIQELVDFATQDRFIYRHKWRAGDLLIWDNRRTLHTGTPFDMKNHIRHIHRTWVRGEVPIPA